MLPLLDRGVVQRATKGMREQLRSQPLNRIKRPCQTRDSIPNLLLRYRRVADQYDTLTSRATMAIQRRSGSQPINSHTHIFGNFLHLCRIREIGR